MSRLSRFTEKPEEIRKSTIDNKDYIFICINIEEHIESIEQSDGSIMKQKYWTANTNEIVAPKDILNYESIKKEPSKYINYKYVDGSSITLEDRINSLEDSLSETIELLLSK